MERTKRIKGIVLYSIIFCIFIFLFSQKLKEEYFDNAVKLLFIIILFIVGGILLFKENISPKFKTGLLLFGMALFVSYPLFSDYIVPQHDIRFHLIRIDNIGEAIKNLEIPVRIHSLDNEGFGYGTSIFYPELFLIIPGILKALNTSVVFAYKVLLVFINFVSVVSMYLCVKNISKSKISAIIGAIIYASANYRLENIFFRGAVGEALAMAFFPIAIWGLYELIYGDKKKWYIFVIGISCIIQSHVLSILFIIGVCAFVGIVFIKNIIKEKRYKNIIISIITIILLNLWFIIPFIDSLIRLDIKIDNFDSTYFEQNAVLPFQLFNFFDKSPGYSYELYHNISLQNELSFTLGILCTFGLIISIIYCYKNRYDNKNMTKFITAITILAILLLVMATTLFPWAAIDRKFEIVKKVVRNIQFSWRFIGVSTVLITITTSIIVGKYVEGNIKSDKKFIENYKIVLIIGLIAVLGTSYFLSDYSKMAPYVKYNLTTTYDLSPNPEYFINGTNVADLVRDKFETSSDKITISNYNKNGSSISFDYNNEVGEGYIEVPLLYYTVYTARDENGNKLEIEAGDNNVIRIKLNEVKNGTISVTSKDTGLYLVSDFISLITFIAFLIYIIMLKKTQKKLLESSKVVENNNKNISVEDGE